MGQIFFPGLFCFLGGNNSFWSSRNFIKKCTPKWYIFPVIYMYFLPLPHLILRIASELNVASVVSFLLWPREASCCNSKLSFWVQWFYLFPLFLLVYNFPYYAVSTLTTLYCIHFCKSFKSFSEQAGDKYLNFTNEDRAPEKLRCPRSKAGKTFIPHYSISVLERE